MGAGEGSAPQPPQQEFVILEPSAHVSEGEGVPETTGDAFHSSEAHEPESSKGVGDEEEKGKRRRGGKWV